MTWNCEICKITIQSASKKRHLKTKKHLKNCTQNENCVICVEPMISSEQCSACKQSWCSACDRNIAICPYCRAAVLGRQVQARQQRINNYNWYYSEEFVPSNQQLFNQEFLDFLNWLDNH